MEQKQYICEQFISLALNNNVIGKQISLRKVNTDDKNVEGCITNFKAYYPQHNVLNIIITLKVSEDEKEYNINDYDYVILFNYEDDNEIPDDFEKPINKRIEYTKISKSTIIKEITYHSKANDIKIIINGLFKEKPFISIYEMLNCNHLPIYSRISILMNYFIDSDMLRNFGYLILENIPNKTLTDDFALKVLNKWINKEYRDSSDFFHNGIVKNFDDNTGHYKLLRAFEFEWTDGRRSMGYAKDAAPRLSCSYETTEDQNILIEKITEYLKNYKYNIIK